MKNGYPWGGKSDSTNKQVFSYDANIDTLLYKKNNTEMRCGMMNNQDTPLNEIL
jgi:hypothetical protein